MQTEYPKIEDVEGPVEINKTYLVPSIMGNLTKNPDHDFWVPIFGQPHVDGPETDPAAEIAGFAHLHIDIRFLTEEELGWISGTDRERESGQWALRLYTKTGKDINSAKRIIWPNPALVKHLPKTCYRQFPSLIFKQNNMSNRQRFEDEFEDCKLHNQCRVCPHQGTDLKSITPINADGRNRIICPAHLLHWDADTGELIRTTPSKKKAALLSAESA